MMRFPQGILARVARKNLSAPLLGLTLAALCYTGPALAAYVTTQEASLDYIFSHSELAATPIDIRIRPTIQYVAPDLLDMNTGAEFETMRNEFFGLPLNIIRIFYADSITWCGGNKPNGLDGCGNSTMLVLESDAAARIGNVQSDEIVTDGGALIAHELGHVLGLVHIGNNVGGPGQSLDNLMNPSIGRSKINLLSSQVALLFADQQGAVQQDANGFFIELQPVLIAASVANVPLPAPLLLLLGALVPLGLFGRKR